MTQLEINDHDCQNFRLFSTPLKGSELICSSFRSIKYFKTFIFHWSNHCSQNIVDISGALFTYTQTQFHIQSNTKEEGAKDAINIWVTVVTPVKILMF